MLIWPKLRPFTLLTSLPHRSHQPHQPAINLLTTYDLVQLEVSSQFGLAWFDLDLYQRGLTLASSRAVDNTSCDVVYIDKYVLTSAIYLTYGG